MTDRYETIPHSVFFKRERRGGMKRDVTGERQGEKSERKGERERQRKIERKIENK